MKSAFKYEKKNNRPEVFFKKIETKWNKEDLVAYFIVQYAKDDDLKKISLK